jgi:hypothetical protein
MREVDGLMATCPKCGRSWPVRCEQAVCIERHGECVPCRFVHGDGTAAEFDALAGSAALQEAGDE